MLRVTKKILLLWITIIFIALIAISMANLDAFLTVYSIIMVFFVTCCFACIKKRLINTLIIFSLFYALLLGFGPIILYYEGFDYYVRIGIYVILSYLCFFLGYQVSNGKKLKLGKRNRLVPENYNTESIYVISIALFLIGIGAYILYFTRSWSTIFGTDLEEGRVVAMTGNGLLLWLGRLAWLAVYMIYEQRIIHDRYKRTSAIMIVTVSIFSVLLGFRSALVDAIFILFFMKNKRKEIPIKKMIIIAILLFAFVGLYGMLRSGGGSVTDSLINEFKVSSVNLNYIVSTFPRKVPFQLGKTYLLDIQALISSDVEGITMWLKGILNLYFSGGGVTPSIIGEFYINWGTAGIILGMLLLGVIFKIIDKAYKDPNNSIFLSCLLLGYIRSIIRGGIGNCTIVLAVYIIGYYCCCNISIKKKLIFRRK